MTDYWFRPKRFGLGVTPASWQGWVATLVVVALSVAIAFLAKRLWMPLIALLIPVLAIYLMLCVNKTEGGLRWRWRGEN